MPVMSKPGFLAKTDSGLRKLLSAEELWNWGKERSSSRRGAIVGQDEQHALEATQTSYPSASLKCPCTYQPPHSEAGKPEGSFNKDEGKCQEKAVKTTEDETEPLSKAIVQKQSHKYLQEKSDSFEKGSVNPSSDDESSSSPSSLSSSSGGPIRVRSLPNSPDGSWRSHKSFGSFASLPEFQRAAAICANISEVSVSSSDIEEELPYDSENIKQKFSNLGSPTNLETTVGSSSEICISLADCKKEERGNSATYNVQNNLRLKNMPTLNKNHDNGPLGAGENEGVSPPTHSGVKIQKDHECTEQIVWPLVQDTSDRDTDVSHETSSGDDGLSETEEKSEAFSHSSEGLASSEEEIILNNELVSGEKNCHSDSLDAGKLKKEGRILNPAQSMHYKRKQLSLDICKHFGMLEKQMLKEKSKMNKPEDFSSWKTIVSEETLSEILSPVDEVLSYGSAELPPSITGATGSNTSNYVFLHPPPASEIITWTSEEDFPPPPGDLNEPQSDRSPAEDPSIKSEDLPSLSEDLFISVNKDESHRQVQRRMSYERLRTDLVMTNCQTSCSGVNSDVNIDKGFQGKNFVSLRTLSKIDGNEFLDPLPSFRIGDRVLVCCSKSGVLKFKGTTSFACGYWAGVALDSPTGYHNGTYQGIQYFKCDKNYGILVRAEEISHLINEEESDLETRVDDDPFSDEEPSNCATPDQEGIGKAKYSRDRLENASHEAPGNDCSVRKNASLLEEMNNNPLQSVTCSYDEVLMLEPFSVSSLTLSKYISREHIQDSTNEAAVLLEKCSLPDLDENLKPQKDCHKNNEQPWNTSVPSSLSVRTNEDAEDLCVDKTGRDPVSLKLHTGCILPIKTPVQHNDPIFYIPDETSVGPISKCHHDLDSFVETLAGNLIKEVIMETEMIMKRHRRMRRSLQDESHILDLNLKKREGYPSRTEQLGFNDQWHSTLPSTAKPKVKVRAHDPSIIHRLVGAAVETLCGHPPSCGVDATDAPHYLVDEESCSAYQKVIFDLASDIFHEILGGHLKTTGFAKKTNLPSSPSVLQPSKATFRNIKAMVQTEVQRVLNLDRNDLQIREMFQKMCKYGKAQRDKVDYILVQELHKEEPQWVDYSHDHLNVKSRLTEEIFEILLQDTISVLKHISTP